MKCKKAEQLILLQDSGELAKNLESTLNEHLTDCDACRSFQDILTESQTLFQSTEEPSATAVQNVLREARLNAPQKKSKIIHLFALKPALAMAASVIIGMGLFFTFTNPNEVGMELVITETQLLEAEEQMVDVMYSGLSEDDLAFNFLMAYDG